MLLLLVAALQLQAYAPMCMALNDPPYAFAAKEFPELTLVPAPQLEHGASLTLTLNPLADVAAHALLLLAAALQLQAYAPMCMALNSPPYAFAA